MRVSKVSVIYIYIYIYIITVVGTRGPNIFLGLGPCPRRLSGLRVDQ